MTWINKKVQDQGEKLPIEKDQLLSNIKYFVEEKIKNIKQYCRDNSSDSKIDPPEFKQLFAFPPSDKEMMCSDYVKTHLGSLGSTTELINILNEQGPTHFILLIDEMEEAYEDFFSNTFKAISLRDFLEDLIHSNIMLVMAFGFTSMQEMRARNPYFDAGAITRIKELQIPVLDPETFRELVKNNVKDPDLINALWWCARGSIGWFNNCKTIIEGASSSSIDNVAGIESEIAQGIRIFDIDKFKDNLKTIYEDEQWCKNLLEKLVVYSGTIKEIKIFGGNDLIQGIKNRSGKLSEAVLLCDQDSLYDYKEVGKALIDSIKKSLSELNYPQDTFEKYGVEIVYKLLEGLSNNGKLCLGFVDNAHISSTVKS